MLREPARPVYRVRRRTAYPTIPTSALWQVTLTVEKKCFCPVSASQITELLLLDVTRELWSSTIGCRKPRRWKVIIDKVIGRRRRTLRAGGHLLKLAVRVASEVSNRGFIKKEKCCKQDLLFYLHFSLILSPLQSHTLLVVTTVRLILVLKFMRK